MHEPETGPSAGVSEARQDVVDPRPETRAGGDVVRTAAHRMLGHLARSTLLLHAPVEVVEVLLEHLMPPRTPVVEQHRDLLERHPGGFAALDDGDAHDLVLAVAPPPRTVPRRPEQTDGLPVPQDVGRQLVSIVDRPGSRLTHLTRENTRRMAESHRLFRRNS